MTAGDGSLADFSVAASFADGQVVLALQGEVDVLTAPEFGAFFETMIDRGHRSVVLDLAGLRFMDASGLAVIAQGADRLEVTGGTLTIRTPMAMIGRMLDITGFARLVQLEPGQSAYGAARSRAVGRRRRHWCRGLPARPTLVRHDQGHDEVHLHPLRRRAHRRRPAPGRVAGRRRRRAAPTGSACRCGAGAS